MLKLNNFSIYGVVDLPIEILGYLTTKLLSMLSYLSPLHGHARVLGAELDGSDVRRAYRPDKANDSSIETIVSSINDNM